MEPVIDFPLPKDLAGIILKYVESIRVRCVLTYPAPYKSFAVERDFRVDDVKSEGERFALWNNPRWLVHRGIILGYVGECKVENSKDSPIFGAQFWKKAGRRNWELLIRKHKHQLSVTKIWFGEEVIGVCDYGVYNEVLIMRCECLSEFKFFLFWMDEITSAEETVMITPFWSVNVDRKHYVLAFDHDLFFLCRNSSYDELEPAIQVWEVTRGL
jgi:hypothetical protein